MSDISHRSPLEITFLLHVSHENERGIEASAVYDSELQKQSDRRKRLVHVVDVIGKSGVGAGRHVNVD